MLLKQSFLLFCLSLLMSLSGFLYAQEYTQGGEIIKESSRTEKAIQIKSNQPEWSALAQRAFATHGAFRQVKSNPTYTFSFDSKGKGRCRLRITAASRVLLEQMVTASSPQQALLMACDLAVKTTTNLPGYFAGKLVFAGERTGNRELWTSDLFFDNAKQLTADRSKSLSPHWAPNGREILYTSYYKTGFPDLYLIDTVSGRRSVFANYQGTNIGGVFSPDGSRVAMILSAKGHPDLYVSGADGKKLKALTDDKAVEASPAWSPNGRQIVYTSDQRGGPQLFLMSADGGRGKPLSTRLSRYVDEAHWNPYNPNLILFTASTRMGYQIGQLNLTSGRSNWITNTGNNSEAVWLNDGRHIVYVQRQGKWSGLRLRDTLSGKDQALHSKAFGNAYQPDFFYP